MMIERDKRILIKDVDAVALSTRWLLMSYFFASFSRIDLSTFGEDNVHSMQTDATLCFTAYLLNIADVCIYVYICKGWLSDIVSGVVAIKGWSSDIVQELWQSRDDRVILFRSCGNQGMIEWYCSGVVAIKGWSSDIVQEMWQSRDDRVILFRSCGNRSRFLAWGWRVHEEYPWKQVWMTNLGTSLCNAPSGYHGLPCIYRMRLDL